MRPERCTLTGLARADMLPLGQIRCHKVAVTSYGIAFLVPRYCCVAPILLGHLLVLRKAVAL